MYDWNTARIACPSGWHLPTRREWGDLAIAAGGTGTYGDSGKAGKILKAKNGWRDNGGGTDNLDFSALPSGTRIAAGGSFLSIGEAGGWWTATEYSSNSAYTRSMNYYYDNVDERYTEKGSGDAVRCIQDAR